MHCTTSAKVIRDNTGVYSEIPVILTAHGPLQSLILYFLANELAHSQQWMAKVRQGVCLLLDYMEANQGNFDNPKELFGAFSQRLTTGTVGLDGADESGLFWQGRSVSTVNQLVNLVTNYSDWMSKNLGTEQLNPWRNATRAEEMLAWAAWHQKRDRAFLAHAWDRKLASIEMTRTRQVMLQKTPIIDHDGVKYFPDDRVSDLLFKGFIVPGKHKSSRINERLNLRNILITVLMHYGGLRMSEPFHLFVHDVMPDPDRQGSALVRIFHPSQGTAPLDWPDSMGKPTRCNRRRYLREKFGIRPRNEYLVTSQMHAGWKGNMLDSNSHAMYVNWFPTWAGELFWKIWILYMCQRVQLQCMHPYAFVTESGTPFAIDTFEAQHSRAIERIGLLPAKNLGTTPHAHRHSFGQRLTDAGISPIFRKKALHHKSLESQTVYTEPNRKKLARALEEASLPRCDGTFQPPPDFLAHGFEDVDPLGLMSGPNPKLRRK